MLLQDVDQSVVVRILANAANDRIRELRVSHPYHADLSLCEVLKEALLLRVVFAHDIHVVVADLVEHADRVLVVNACQETNEERRVIRLVRTERLHQTDGQSHQSSGLYSVISPDFPNSPISWPCTRPRWGTVACRANRYPFPRRKQRPLFRPGLDAN